MTSMASIRICISISIFLFLFSLIVLSSFYVVREGDSLAKIAYKVYGSYSKWKYIYEANKDIIRNPRALKVGMRLLIPEDNKKREPYFMVKSTDVTKPISQNTPEDIVKYVFSNYLYSLQNHDEQRFLSLHSISYKDTFGGVYSNIGDVIKESDLPQVFICRILDVQENEITVETIYHTDESWPLIYKLVREWQGWKIGSLDDEFNLVAHILDKEEVKLYAVKVQMSYIVNALEKYKEENGAFPKASKVKSFKGLLKILSPFTDKKNFYKVTLKDYTTDENDVRMKISFLGEDMTVSLKGIVEVDME